MKSASGMLAVSQRTMKKRGVVRVTSPLGWGANLSDPITTPAPPFLGWLVYAF